MAEQTEQDRRIEEAFQGMQALMETFTASMRSVTASLALMSNLMQLMQERYGLLHAMLRAREAGRE